MVIPHQRRKPAHSRPVCFPSRPKIKISPLIPDTVTTAHSPARINLKLRELSQLFNSMDPSPFIDRDLDGDAEEFIVSWARELPRNRRFELVIHLASVPDPGKAAEVESAVQHYFASRALMKRREFQQLLRRGHMSLSIGLIFLTACLLASGLAGKLGHASAAVIMHEGLLIAGWVAMWRPLEIYLYDWWPLRQEWRTLQRLSRMHVRLVPPHGLEAGVRHAQAQARAAVSTDNSPAPSSP